MCTHCLDSARAYATRRPIDDALECAVIIAVGDQPEVSEGVLDLGALEEAQPAVDPIRYSCVDKPLFEHARLRVGAIQDRRVGADVTLINPVAQAGDHKIRFVAFVVSGVQLDRLAVGAVGPQVLAHARIVVRDQGIRGTEYRGRGAIVLLELDDLRGREIFLKPENVLDSCATPAIYGLVVVADDKRHAGISGEQPQPGVLNRVGVLKLVDEQMAEATPIVREQFRIVAPQLMRPQQQLREIDKATALAQFRVGGVQ